MAAATLPALVSTLEGKFKVIAKTEFRGETTLEVEREIAELVTDKRGQPPLLLLDEVAAHLDPLRREALFARLTDSGTQVWFTGTETAPFAPILGESAVWRVAEGEAVRA